MDECLRRGIINIVATIVDRGKGDKVTQIYNEYNIHFHFICHGEGTATSEVLDILGLLETDKDVVFSMVPARQVPDLLSKITEKMYLHKAGKGIVFSLPVSGIGSIISKIVNKEVLEKLEEHLSEEQLKEEIDKIRSSIKHCLIVSIVNHGHTDTVMEAAKGAGATGGTILHARGAGYEEAANFLGISIQAEKEVVLILTSKADRGNILDAINRAAGIKTEARGIIFSIPVEQIAGISKISFN